MPRACAAHNVTLVPAVTCGAPSPLPVIRGRSFPRSISASEQKPTSLLSSSTFVPRSSLYGYLCVPRSREQKIACPEPRQDRRMTGRVPLATSPLGRRCRRSPPIALAILSHQPAAKVPTKTQECALDERWAAQRWASCEISQWPCASISLACGHAAAASERVPSSVQSINTRFRATPCARPTAFA